MNLQLCNILYRNIKINKIMITSAQNRWSSWVRSFSCHLKIFPLILLCCAIRARFLSLARSKLRLCSANHWAGYFSNLACDWLSIVWAYSEQKTKNGPSFPQARPTWSLDTRHTGGGALAFKQHVIMWCCWHLFWIRKFSYIQTNLIYISTMMS